MDDWNAVRSNLCLYYTILYEMLMIFYVWVFFFFNSADLLKFDWNSDNEKSEKTKNNRNFNRYESLDTAFNVKRKNNAKTTTHTRSWNCYACVFSRLIHSSGKGTISIFLFFLLPVIQLGRCFFFVVRIKFSKRHNKMQRHWIINTWAAAEHCTNEEWPSSANNKPLLSMTHSIAPRLK